MFKAGTSAGNLVRALCALIAVLFATSAEARAGAHDHHAQHHHMAHQGHAGPSAGQAPRGADAGGMAWNGRGATTQANMPAGSDCPMTADPEHCEACPDAAILSLARQRRDAALAQADRTVVMMFATPRSIAPPRARAVETRPPIRAAASRKHQRCALFARLRL